MKAALRNRMIARALRLEARRKAGRSESVQWLMEFRVRVRESGQDFHLIPGAAIIDRAIKVERRRHRLHRLATLGLLRMTASHR